MAEKLYVTEDHQFWEIFRDVGHHETAALIYLTDVLWAIHTYWMEKAEEAPDVTTK